MAKKNKFPDILAGVVLLLSTTNKAITGTVPFGKGYELVAERTITDTVRLRKKGEKDDDNNNGPTGAAPIGGRGPFGSSILPGILKQLTDKTFGPFGVGGALTQEDFERAVCYKKPEPPLFLLPNRIASTIVGS